MIALLAMLFACTFSLAPVSAQGTFIRGDVNQDEGVSFSDLIPLVHFVLLDDDNLNCHDSADINDDGSLNLADIFSMLTLLFDPNDDSGLPAPYPQAGTDGTPDTLPLCGNVTQDPAGSEIQHIYFHRDGSGIPGIAGYPGQQGLQLPVFLDSSAEVEGYTLSLQYNVDDVAQLSFDFQGTVADDFGADLQMAELTATPGFVYAYTVMELLPPYTPGSMIPAGEELLLGTLVVDLACDLPIGARVRFEFASTPPQGIEPAVRNELVIDGDSSFPEGHDLEVMIFEEEQLFTRGDSNHDGLVNLIDAIATLQFIFAAGEPVCNDAADVNDDGFLGIPDVMALLGYLFVDSSVSPAPPFPYLGIDPTPSDLFDGCD